MGVGVQVSFDEKFIHSTLKAVMYPCIHILIRYWFFQLKGSTMKHGISLQTLIRKSADLSGPCLLVNINVPMRSLEW